MSRARLSTRSALHCVSNGAASAKLPGGSHGDARPASGNAMSEPTIEITRLAKAGGPLTKRIFLGPDGKPTADGSACVMGRGTACRVRVNNLEDLARLIGWLEQHEAIALGTLRAELPDHVQLTTATALARLNGHAAPDLIARTAEFILYRAGTPALAMLDLDRKGMPPAIADRLHNAGGLRSLLAAIVPEFVAAGSVVRSSTSSGIVHGDTGERFAGSGGLHIFIPVEDGEDVGRFLHALHRRCWLAGFGWLMVGAGGQLLERSVVDRTVGSPERLVFEAPPIAEWPLRQECGARQAEVIEGGALDTRRACPDLNPAEEAVYRDLRAAAAHSLSRQASETRNEFIKRQSAKIGTKFGLPLHAAQWIVERQTEGVLLPNVELEFDDPDLRGSTVEDVLADPVRFTGATLADPLEGPDYGPCKAKVMRRSDGTLWIHSFAHGRTVYELRRDRRLVEAALQQADKTEVPELFARLLLTAELPPGDAEPLYDAACHKSGLGKRAIAAAVSAARARHAEGRAREKEQQRAAERIDQRLRMLAPRPDAERLPIVRALDHVLREARDDEPPMRDLDGRPVEVRSRQPLMLHQLTGAGANATESNEDRVPPPELPLLTPHDNVSLAHLVERHVEYFDRTDRGTERPVALSPVFIEHYMRYRDSALPRVGAVVTMPLVLPDGSLLAPRGLDRARKLVFRIGPNLINHLPPAEMCSERAVREAMRFLLHEWLVDVATDFTGKCVLIAAALTIIERALLPERPAFFVTAGHRGGGKTTTTIMLALATTGRKPPAAAWSSNEEERRKALFAYLSEGLPTLCWDNIPRGATLSCPSIEKALTNESYSDRVLGHSVTQTVPATTVMFFTGNNVEPRGDLASRSLTIRLTVDRPDPENRSVQHADPIDWTMANRNQILRALYTLLLGNPQLRPGPSRKPETRFKTWWDLVGSAVEHAAGLLAQEHGVNRCQTDRSDPSSAVAVRFRDLFNNSEAEEEQTSALANILAILRDRWPYRFQAVDVARLLAETENGINLKSLIEQATGKPMPVTSAVATTWRLKTLADSPVQSGDHVLTLRRLPHHEGNWFEVAASPRV